MSKLKIASITMALILLLSIMPPPTLAGNADLDKVDATELSFDEILQHHEDESLRTEYAKAYVINDEQIAYVVAQEKQFYKDENNVYQPIDNSIVAQKNIDGYTFKNAANDIKQSFGLNKAGQSRVKLETDDYSVSFTLISDRTAQLIAGQKLDVKNTMSIKRGDESETIQGYLQRLNSQDNTLIYKQVFDNADAAYTVKGDKLKEDIVFYSIPQMQAISYFLETNGLILEQETQVFDAVNEDTGEPVNYSITLGFLNDPATNEKIFEISNMYLIDANFKSSKDLNWDYEAADNGYIITVYLDQDYLNDPNVTYPVILDPTTSVYTRGSSNTKDTYASKKNGDSNYYLSNYLRTGYDSNYGIRRTFIRWDLPTVGNKYPIEKVVTWLTKYSSGGTMSLRAVQLTTSWDPKSVTWWTSPNSVTKPVYEQTAGTSPYTIDITPLGRAWYCGRYSNFGIKIYDNVESSGVWGTFYSSDYSSSGSQPYLVVYYNTSSNLYLHRNGPLYGKSFTIKNNSKKYGAWVTWALIAWNTSEAGVTIAQNANSSNEISDKPDPDHATRTGWIEYRSKTFNIYLNTSVIDSYNQWDGYAQSVIVHELGHALGLADMEKEKYCIMGYDRDRDHMLYPTLSDITGVKNR